MNILYGEYNGAKTVTLQNRTGMTVKLCALGAGIMSITVPDRDGVAREVTVLPDGGYGMNINGMTLGRTAGRIANAEFCIDGRRAVLEKNSFSRDNINGGSDGLHTKTFELSVEENEGHTDAVFFYSSEDGEGGYFGGVNIYVTYRVYDGVNTFMLFYRGEPDRKLLLNLTNCVMFNVGGDGRECVTEHELYVNASRVGALNSRLLTYKTVAVTPEFDFRSPHKIGKHIGSKRIQKYSGGYEHAFFLDSRRADSIACAVYSELSGIKLEISTSYPCAVIYTDNGGGHKAVAAECQYHPDGIHKDINDCGICTPRNPYNALIVYGFSAGEGIKPMPLDIKDIPVRLG